MNDNRNVIDEFKGVEHDEIVRRLDRQGSQLEAAIENLEHDFNIGTIVRSANAFGVRNVHIIGRRQWNKRGAMVTDKYLHVHYHESADNFVKKMKADHRSVIAIENNVNSEPLATAKLPERAVLVFGSEGSGLSDELLLRADAVFHIEQRGSTRSINVSAAAAIAMYEWLRRHVLS